MLRDLRFRSALASALLAIASSWTLSACGGQEGSSDTTEPTGNSESGAGGADSGSARSFDVGVSGDKHASKLTEDEVDRVCQATRDYAHQFITPEYLCRAAAGMAALDENEGVAQCQESYESCVESASDEELACVLGPECDITVGEYETCVEQMVTTAEPILKNFPSCEEVTPFAMLQLALLTELPACRVVQERCGSLLP